MTIHYIQLYPLPLIIILHDMRFFVLGVMLLCGMLKVIKMNSTENYVNGIIMMMPYQHRYVI